MCQPGIQITIVVSTYMIEVFPTPESPNITTLSIDFFLEAIFDSDVTIISLCRIEVLSLELYKPATSCDQLPTFNFKQNA